MFERKMKIKILLLLWFVILIFVVFSLIYSVIYEENRVYVKIWTVPLPVIYFIVYLRALLREP
jgi:hypothetical protein